MAGLLTHLIVGFIGLLIIYFSFYNTSSKRKIIYGLIFTLANILPDIVNYGAVSLLTFSFNPDKLMFHPYFDFLTFLSHTLINWIILAAIIIVIAFLLYKFKKISKKSFIFIAVSLILIVIGVFFHLLFDEIIRENSHWI